MKNIIKIGFPILCVTIVGGTLIAIGNLKNQADKISEERNSINYSNIATSNNTNTYNNSTNYNNISNSLNTNNTITNSTINTVTNTNTGVEENKISNTQNKIVNSENKNTNSEVTSEDYSGSKEKEKAIELVAKEWGEDSSVYFTNEGISSGMYIVAVRDKSNTSVKMFYKVDLKNNSVEVDW